MKVDPIVTAAPAGEAFRGQQRRHSPKWCK
jgi:hypothetical protein